MVVGPSEYGKTSIARSLVRRHLAETPNGLAFVSDPVGQFGRDGCYWYPSTDAWRARARDALKPDGAPMPRGASFACGTDEIVALAKEVGERVGNTQWDVRQRILVVFDEGSTSESSGATWMGKQDEQSLAMRRHRGNGFVFNIQEPTMLHPRFFLFATDFYIFVQTARHAAVLDERLALEKGTMQRAGVCTLPPHRYVHARKVVGVVQEEL
jgi:hypothetical protein